MPSNRGAVDETLSGPTFGIRTKFRDLSVQRNHHNPTVPNKHHLTGIRSTVATKTPSIPLHPNPTFYFIFS